VLVSATFVHSLWTFFKLLYLLYVRPKFVHLLAFCQVNVLNEYDDDDDDDK